MQSGRLLCHHRPNANPQPSPPPTSPRPPTRGFGMHGQLRGSSVGRAVGSTHNKPTHEALGWIHGARNCRPPAAMIGHPQAQNSVEKMRTRATEALHGAGWQGGGAKIAGDLRRGRRRNGEHEVKFPSSEVARGIEGTAKGRGKPDIWRKRADF